jgi:ATP synthase protein I
LDRWRFCCPEAVSGGDCAAFDPVLSIGRILLAQLAVGGVFAAPLWLWQAEPAALSWLLGSIICVVPNAFVAALMLVRRTDARAALRALYWGEAGKLALTVALFVIVFERVRPLRPGWLFAGLIATQSISLFALIWTRGNNSS